MQRGKLSTRCCIVGAGPCGLMLALLLARAGVDVVVLEKHGDFLRDFRGDLLQPSTFEVISELGLLDELLKLPHRKETTQNAYFGGRKYPFADFTGLPTRCKFIAYIRQWDFLNFLAESGKRYPSYHLHMCTEVLDLIKEDGRVVGVYARAGDEPIEVRADLTVGCDGRDSAVRARAGLTTRDLGSPSDMLWFRLPKESTDPDQTFGRIEAGSVLVAISREGYWQCGLHVPKGSTEQRRRAGLPAFRQGIARLVPEFADRLDELRDWEEIKTLVIANDRLDQWYQPGVLCIGDAAHAMSPIGGVGVNLAVQDAVAAANMLWEPLRAGTLQARHLHQVQRRRMFPTRLTQRLVIFLNNRVVNRALTAGTDPKAPLLLRLLSRFAALRRIEARVMGLGPRPEHVRTPTAPLTLLVS